MLLNLNIILYLSFTATPYTTGAAYLGSSSAPGRASEPELCGQCNALACLERSEQCPPLIARYFISGGRGGGPSERDAVSCSPSPLSPAAAAVTTTRTVLCIHWAGKEEMGTALHCGCWEFWGSIPEVSLGIIFQSCVHPQTMVFLA